MPTGREMRGGDTRFLRGCATCRWWRPHFHYPSIGYCVRHGRLTLDEDSCEEWEPLRVERGKFYWCLDCRRRLSWEEAEIFLRRGARVYESAYVDPDVREEIVGSSE